MWDRRRVRPALSVAAACLTAGTAACGGEGGVTVGVTTVQSYLNAARMALDADAPEGLPPGVDTLLIPDPTNRSAPAIEAAQRLVGVEDMVAVVGHSNSAASLAASQIYNDHEIVQLAPTASATVYSRAGPYSFRLVPPDDRQGAFLADYLADRFPAGARLAVLYVNDDYGKGLRRALLDALDPSLFEVVAEIPHIETEIEEEDLARTRATLADVEPDAILGLVRGTVLHRFLPGIRDALGDVPVVGGDAMGTGRLRPNDDGRWDGVVFVDFVDIGATPELRAFARAYEERFGASATGAQALTYDAVRVVLAGLRTGATTGSEMRDYLLSLGRDREPFEGVTGPISFDEQGDVDRSYVLLPVHPPGDP